MLIDNFIKSFILSKNNPSIVKMNKKKLHLLTACSRMLITTSRLVTAQSTFRLWDVDATANDKLTVDGVEITLTEFGAGNGNPHTARISNQEGPNSTSWIGSTNGLSVDNNGSTLTDYIGVRVQFGTPVILNTDVTIWDVDGYNSFATTFAVDSNGNLLEPVLQTAGSNIRVQNSTPFNNAPAGLSLPLNSVASYYSATSGTGWGSTDSRAAFTVSYGSNAISELFIITGERGTVPSVSDIAVLATGSYDFTATPEPASTSLLALGSLSLLLRRKR